MERKGATFRLTFGPAVFVAEGSKAFLSHPAKPLLCKSTGSPPTVFCLSTDRPPSLLFLVTAGEIIL